MACGAEEARAPDADPGAGSECVPASRRCWASVVQICDAAGRWQNEEACAVACEDGACAGACAEGSARCDGAVAQRCEAGRWGNEAACPFACSDGACVGICAEGDARCDGLLPQVCADGTWTAASEACTYACEAGACAGACKAGAARCWDDVVQRCADDGTWQNEASCPFACVDGACAGECVDGSARCDGLRAQRCAGGFWEDEAACAFGCTAGACTGVCTPGAERCSGDAIERCDGSGAWNASEVCPFVCADARCAGECAPGAVQCADDAVQACDGSGTWQTVQACASGCAGGACVQACVPGQVQCFGDVRQGCDATGQWRSDEHCALGCSDGRCLECAPGATSCSGIGVSTCAEPGFWEVPVACASGSCVDGACAEVPPSCAGGGAGVSDCGPSGGGDCCASVLVPGGSFLQDNDARHPATVSAFRLDTYEITVGRFRKFVEAMQDGWLPQAGDGRHVHLAGGRGLVERGTADAWEPGWDPAWTARLPADWNAAITGSSCNWTAQPGANENKAMNCIHWQEAYAFCIWDGGFLPSEAEWNFAAAGGDEQRLYPWGDADPESGDYAMHAEACPGGWCTAPYVVGTKPLGAGRWGHLDLSANAGEWVLDWYEDPYPAGAPCVDCVNLASTRTMRTLRGGAHWDPPNDLISTEIRNYGTPNFRVIGAGARCARAP